MTLYPKLTNVTATDDFILLLEFGGTEKRKYDFSPNLLHAFYRPLSDAEVFKRVTVRDGEIAWVTGQDFCPHTLYENSLPWQEG